MTEEKKKKVILSRTDLIKKVAVATEIEEKIVGTVLGAVETEIVDSCKNDEEVRLLGFGTFALKYQAARKGRNPQTGAEIKIAAKKVIKFKPGNELADSVK